MKKRVASFLLATLAVVSLFLPALAAAPPLPAEGLPEEPGAESVEIEEVESAIRLDGENVQNVEYEFRNGVCYITVSSFVSMLDAEAVVEEENGAVRVNAVTVTGVIPVETEPGAGPETEPEAGGEGDESEPEAGDEPEAGTDPESGAEAEPETGHELTQAEDGAEVPEPAEETTAGVETADLTLSAEAGDAYFVANGRHLYTKDGLIDLNGRVAAPVRQLAQVFNLSVGFDAEEGQVLLDHREGAEPYLADADYDGDILYWLSHIIYTESGNQPLEGKIAVGNVVMNRVKDPRFPNTVYDVLFQKNQFTPVSTGSIYREPNEESVLAAKLVMDGAVVTPTALFFNGVGGRAFRGRTYVTTIGSHNFYK